MSCHTLLVLDTALYIDYIALAIAELDGELCAHVRIEHRDVEVLPAIARLGSSTSQQAKQIKDNSYSPREESTASSHIYIYIYFFIYICTQYRLSGTYAVP